VAATPPAWHSPRVSCRARWGGGGTGVAPRPVTPRGGAPPSDARRARVRAVAGPRRPVAADSGTRGRWMRPRGGAAAVPGVCPLLTPGLPAPRVDWRAAAGAGGAAVWPTPPPLRGAGPPRPFLCAGQHGGGPLPRPHRRWRVPVARPPPRPLATERLRLGAPSRNARPRAPAAARRGQSDADEIGWAMGCIKPHHCPRTRCCSPKESRPARASLSDLFGPAYPLLIVLAFFWGPSAPVEPTPRRRDRRRRRAHRWPSSAVSNVDHRRKC